MSARNETLFVLTGCTAVGKTRLALDWAESHDAEIVSCDSLLFYRGMDIGTAKPSPEELNRVPHHLIDICSPGAQMDIGAFVSRAITTIEAIRSRGKRVLVTGGSGFYLKAFFEPVVDAVEISEKTKERVQAISDKEGLEGMVAALSALDPASSEAVDIQNPRRVVRALERCLETGKSVRQLKEDFSRQKNALTEAGKKLVILERDKAELDQRIDERVRAMLAQGLIDEVKRLKAEGFESNASGAGSIGYRETLEYLRGECDYESLISNIIFDTRRLAKKQRTWFRTQMPVGKALNLTKNPDVEVDSLFEDLGSGREGTSRNAK